MPRFTCESCATSLYSATRAANLTDCSCPTCGASLDHPELEHDDGVPVPAAPIKVG
jgi:hypothetical protein